jgi:hypothetical protein
VLGGDDLDLMLRRGDLAFFPGVEADRDLGFAGADLRGNPNRVIEVDRSASPL